MSHVKVGAWAHLLVAAGHGHGCPLRAQRRAHGSAAIGAGAGQPGRVELQGAVGQVAEVAGRAVRRHRGGGGHKMGVTVEERGCRVSRRLG